MTTRANVRLVFLVVASCGLACATRVPVAPPAMVPPPQTAAAPAAPLPVAPVPAAVPTPTAGAASARATAAPPLVGAITRDDLREYAPWQQVLTQAYAPEPAVVRSITGAARDVTVFAIVATWCPDTKRELPRFFAIMEASGIPETALTMVAVDRTKKDAEGMTERLGITRVPTFVFLRKGEEIGRFVERVPPDSTLEREIARVLAGPAK